MIIIGGRMRVIFASPAQNILQYNPRSSAFSLPIMMALTLQGKRHGGLHEYCIN